MIDLKNKRILVTGSNGFFGHHVCRTLEKRGAEIVHTPRKKYDLRIMEKAFDLFLDEGGFNSHIEFAICLAANTGGITYNRKNPATLFYDNIMITTNTLQACTIFKVKKVINVTSSCSYPDGLEILSESDHWNGSPNSSVESFGIAKRSSEVFARALRKQYGSDIITTCVTNLYGPGDNFSGDGKVVGNLIRKFVESKRGKYGHVECLGTGNPLREFMFVEDAAEALVQVLERYEGDPLINIGTGHEISIKSLANLIADIVGYKGLVHWNVGAGDGQMRKLLDVIRMKESLDVPITSLEDGLRKTISWYITEESVK